MSTDGAWQSNLTKHPASDCCPSWSPDGQKIAFQSNRDGNWEIYVMNVDGTEQTNLTNHPADDCCPSWSPDGRKIAFLSNRDDEYYDSKYYLSFWGEPEIQLSVRYGDRYRIYVMSPHGTIWWGPIGGGSGFEGVGDRVSWSPDSTRIAFVKTRGYFDVGGIYAMNVDGTSETNLTRASPGDYLDHPDDCCLSWSPDGEKIAFSSRRKDSYGYDIYVMFSDGTKVTRLTSSWVDECCPSWSPDGKKLAFTSRVDGKDQIYVMNADGTNQIRLTEGEANNYGPVWSPR